VRIGLILVNNGNSYYGGIVMEIKKVILIFLLVSLIPGYILGLDKTDKVDKSIEELKNNLSAKDIKIRINTILEINNYNISEEKKLEILLDEIKSEVRNPTDGYPPIPIWMNSNQFLIYKIIMQISKLNNNLLPIVQSYYSESSGKERDIYEIILVLLGDHSHINNLKKIIINSNDLGLRYTAFNVLIMKKLCSIEDKDMYKTLLKDKECVKSRTDFIVDRSSLYECPMQPLAYTCMHEIGVNVKRSKDGSYYIVDETK
jgi:hypothetical protein